MKTKLSYLAILALALTLSAGAETQVQVSVIDGDFEVVDADVSHLAVGESEIIYAGDKEITLTRTNSGIEVLVDGEELGDSTAGLMRKCEMQAHIETHCEGEDCAAESEATNIMVMRNTTGSEDLQLNCFNSSSMSQHTWVSADGSEELIRTLEIIRSDEQTLHEVGDTKAIMIKKTNEEG